MTQQFPMGMMGGGLGGYGGGGGFGLGGSSPWDMPPPPPWYGAGGYPQQFSGYSGGGGGGSGSFLLNAALAIGPALFQAVIGSNSGNNDNGYCATCAILALLTGAQTASTPGVAHPVALVSAEIAITGEALRIASCHVAFRSRGPPLS